MDVVTLDLVWNRLIHTATEQMQALLHTAFSTIVRESEDCATGVFDRHGTLLAQAPSGTPGQINSMGTCLPSFLAVHPAAELRPGDVLISNDPWKMAGHLNDITVVTPIFREGRLVAFFGSCAHALDIGGRGFASDSRSVHEEGLFIPITKLADAGQLNTQLLEIIRANVRSPDLVIGDVLGPDDLQQRWWQPAPGAAGGVSARHSGRAVPRHQPPYRNARSGRRSRISRMAPTRAR